MATWVLTILMAVRSCEMFNQMRNKSTTSGARNDSKKNENNNIELIRTFFVILSVFTLTILPIFVCLLALIIRPPDTCVSSASSGAFFAGSFVYSAGCFLNALIYNFFHKEFRSGARALMHDAAQPLAGVFPCLNALLPYSRQRERSSSFISTTLSRIRSRRSVARKSRQGSPVKNARAVEMSMTSTCDSTSASRNTVDSQACSTSSGV